MDFKGLIPVNAIHIVGASLLAIISVATDAIASKLAPTGDR